MLRTSPGDGGSSLPVHSFDPPLPGNAVDSQASVESDREQSASPLEAFVDDDRDSSELAGNVPLSSIRFNAENSSIPVVSHTTMEPHTGMSQPLRQAAWLKPSSQDVDLDGLYALRQAAALKTMRQMQPRSGSTSLVALSDKRIAATLDQFPFAEPLSPLRERDLTALSEFFQRDDITVLEADINQRLLLLLPEPCWEDSPFDFLTEFL
ncbi:MAG: hypothetical protein ACAF41_28860 [Leptolyngbya sp. BL-A-14]